MPFLLIKQEVRYSANAMGWLAKHHSCKFVNPTLCRCDLLGVCESYGMPSSHTQAIAYCLAAYIVVWLRLRRQKASHLQRVLTVGEVAGLGLLAAAVGYARVYLGYHTPLQVGVGGLVGLLFGALWTQTCLAVVRKQGPSILRTFSFLGALGFCAEQQIFTRKLN